MSRLWLVTGATGHVGTVLVSELLKRGEEVRAFTRPGSAVPVPGQAQVCYGDITEPSTLVPFFDRAGHDSLILVHCAAFITIASKEHPAVRRTNVEGTVNVMHAAVSAGVERAVYVSSVHAIPEKPEPETITEVDSFSPDLVHGQYAKSKAEAAQTVLDFAAKGLDVSIVHPSGIIGPGDVLGRNHMVRTLRAMADGSIPFGIEGGYDFVDSRDVAQGILGCAEMGRKGECYILSGHYVEVPDLVNMVRRAAGKRPVRAVLPYGAAKLLAGAGEKLSLLFGKKPPLFTPYSVYTLHTNGRFSHEKASEEFGYCPRELEISVRDSLG